jgi:hypothetical protein
MLATLACSSTVVYLLNATGQIPFTKQDRHHKKRQQITDPQLIIYSRSSAAVLPGVVPAPVPGVGSPAADNRRQQRQQHSMLVAVVQDLAVCLAGVSYPA